MKPEIHFIDSNIPMYAAGADHPLKAPCLAILKAVAEKDLSAVSSVEVLQELLHRYTALGHRQRAVAVASAFMEIVVEILPVIPEDVVRAMEILHSLPRIQTRDVMHVAVMRRHGITTIISADKHFDAVPDLIRLDPASWR